MLRPSLQRRSGAEADEVAHGPRVAEERLLRRSERFRVPPHPSEGNAEIQVVRPVPRRGRDPERRVIRVNFRVGVQAKGNFSFFTIWEALP